MSLFVGERARLSPSLSQSRRLMHGWWSRTEKRIDRLPFLELKQLNTMILIIPSGKTSANTLIHFSPCLIFQVSYDVVIMLPHLLLFLFPCLTNNHHFYVNQMTSITLDILFLLMSHTSVCTLVFTIGKQYSDVMLINH